MFLISWRGYWQELMDMIFVILMKTPQATFLICLGAVYDFSEMQTKLISNQFRANRAFIGIHTSNWQGTY